MIWVVLLAIVRLHLVSSNRQRTGDAMLTPPIRAVSAYIFASAMTDGIAFSVDVDKVEVSAVDAGNINNAVR